jgi:hypothetical protein
MSSRRLPALVAAAVAAATLSGCAGIPTSGSVHKGRPLPLERQDAAVQFIAEAPVPGATAVQVVQGFLRASADFRGDHEVARMYLTSRAAQRWRPAPETLVHDGGAPPGVQAGDDGSVAAQVTEVARIDADGSYRRTPGSPELTRTFRMEREDGEWRIGGLDDGLVLSQLDVDQTYRQVSLYFLSPSRNSLVPDVVMLPELPGLTTKVVSRLLRGPTADLRGAVLTAFPQGTQLEVQSVPVSEGLATVSLDDAVLVADQDAREQMSAQIVWTLKQLGSQIERVRVTAGGDDRFVQGVAQDQDLSSWVTYDPDSFSGSPSVYVVQGPRVGRIIEGRFQPLTGPAGSGDIPVRTPAVSLDTTELAAVSTDGTVLRAGRISADGTFSAVLTGGDLSQPSWDPLGNLWVVDRSTGQLLLLPDGQAPAVQVTVPRLPGGRLSQVVVSRDGARVAMVSGRGEAARLTLGAVTGIEDLDPDATDTPHVAVQGEREILPQVRGVRDVAWTNATTLTVLGSLDGAPVAPFTTTTDGYDVVSVEPHADLVTIAAAPLSAESGPLIGATTDGELRQYTSGRGWVSFGEGTDPAYPG